ncbi:MAG: TlpA family protein disulfide reductase [Chloroflexi bacterium]|nr:TlpA family protein disulfide reductase [Chloroflexota bacterium]
MVAVLLAACGRTPAPSKLASSDAGLAPDFKVRTLVGQDFVLSQQRGRPVVLFFVAAWCGSCYPKANALGRLYDRHRGQGLQVLILDIDSSEGPEDLLLFKQRAKGGEHHWALDRNNVVTQLYKVRYLDATVIIDRQGRIVFNGQFPFAEEDLVQRLREAL